MKRLLGKNKNNYKAVFKIYGLGALGLYLAGNFVVFHFGYRFMKSFMGEYSWGETARLFGQLLPNLGSVGYTFNIFIDLLLCTLLFFFMTYEPKKVFTGKKIILFRLLVLIPIALEIVGIIIKYCLVTNKLTIPSYIFFLLPSKPPLIFLAFVVIVFALKIGAAKFKKHHPEEENLYQEHISTNAHSLKTSIIISTIFLVMAILDFVVMIIIMMRAYVMACAATEVEEEIELIATSNFNSWLSIGFGGAVSLLPVIPIVMFFDYKKEHQNKKVDSLLPLIGIGLIAIVYVEGIFEIIINNIPSIIEKIKEIFSMFM